MQSSRARAGRPARRLRRALHPLPYEGERAISRVWCWQRPSPGCLFLSQRRALDDAVGQASRTQERLLKTSNHLGSQLHAAQRLLWAAQHNTHRTLPFPQRRALTCAMLSPSPTPKVKRTISCYPAAFWRSPATRAFYRPSTRCVCRGAAFARRISHRTHHIAGGALARGNPKTVHSH